MTLIGLKFRCGLLSNHYHSLDLILHSRRDGAIIKLCHQCRSRKYDTRHMICSNNNNIPVHNIMMMLFFFFFFFLALSTPQINLIPESAVDCCWARISLRFSATVSAFSALKIGENDGKHNTYWQQRG